MRKPTDVAPAIRANSVVNQTDRNNSQQNSGLYGINELSKRTLSVRLATLLHQMETILKELIQWLKHERIHVRHGYHSVNDTFTSKSYKAN